MAASIKYVEPGSPAARAGIQAGEALLTIGGHPVRDVLDYKFYGYDARLTLEVADAAGTRRTVSLRTMGRSAVRCITPPPRMMRSGLTVRMRLAHI